MSPLSELPDADAPNSLFDGPDGSTTPARMFAPGGDPFESPAIPPPRAGGPSHTLSIAGPIPLCHSLRLPAVTFPDYSASATTVSQS